MVSGDDVLLEITGGMQWAKPNVGVGGEVEDDVVPGNDLVQRTHIEQVRLDEFKASLPRSVFEERTLTGREVVVHRDRVAERQQAIDETAGNEPGATRDECSQRA